MTSCIGIGTFESGQYPAISQYLMLDNFSAFFLGKLNRILFMSLTHSLRSVLMQEVQLKMQTPCLCGMTSCAALIAVDHRLTLVV